MLSADMLIECVFVRTNQAAKLALEYNVVLRLEMFLVEVVRRRDELAAQLLTFEGGRFLSLSSIGLGARAVLCQVV